MAVDIEVIKCLQICRNRRKIFQIGFVLAPALIEGRIIGILPVAQVGRGDDEIIVVCFGKSSVPAGQMGLHTKLYTEAEGDPVCIFFF